jgi:hypothetical protein
MRYLIGFLLVLVLALGITPLLGCSDTDSSAGVESGGTGGTVGTGGIGGTGGTVGTGGSGGTGGMPGCERPEGCNDGKECTEDTCIGTTCEFTPIEDGTACADGECLDGVCAPTGAFPCTEQGVRNAIAEGGGPHFFACDGPTTVVTGAEIAIDNDVILDGRSDLTIDGGADHRVFSVPDGVTAELRGFGVTGGATEEGENGGGIWNGGAFTLMNSTVSGNTAGGVGGGIHTDGTLSVTKSTVSDNSAVNGGGIHVGSDIAIGNATLSDSTVSQNAAENGIGGGIRGWRGTVTLVSTTVSGNSGASGGAISLQPAEATAVLTNTLVDGQCFDLQSAVTSTGHNIESPGNTCSFDQGTDQFNVSAEELNLGPLRDNGGPTGTHALLPGSAALDRIPEAMCEVDEDQRGVPRPQSDACDVGAFEFEP